MHHKHDSLLAKIASAQIEMKIVTPWCNYSFSALPLEYGAEDSTSRPVAATVLRLIDPVASGTFRDIVASVRDCFTLTRKHFFTVATLIEKKRTCAHIFQFEHS